MDKATREICSFCSHTLQHLWHDDGATVCGLQCTCRCEWGYCYRCHKQSWGYAKHRVGQQWWQPSSCYNNPSDAFLCIHCLQDDEIAWCAMCDKLDYAVQHPATDQTICLDCLEKHVEVDLYEQNLDNNAVCYTFTLVDGTHYHTHIQFTYPCRSTYNGDDCLKLIDKDGDVVADRYCEHIPAWADDDVYPDITVSTTIPNVLQRLLHSIVDMY